MTLKLQAKARLLADWWSNMTADQQKQYIKNHPGSKKAQDARDAASPAAKKPKAPASPSKPTAPAAAKPAKKASAVLDKAYNEKAVSKFLLDNVDRAELNKAAAEVEQALKRAAHERWQQEQDHTSSEEMSRSYLRRMRPVLKPTLEKLGISENELSDTAVVNLSNGLHSLANGKNPNSSAKDKKLKWAQDQVDAANEQIEAGKEELAEQEARLAKARAAKDEGLINTFEWRIEQTKRELVRDQKRLADMQKEVKKYGG